jgi:cytochrome P450
MAADPILPEDLRLVSPRYFGEHGYPYENWKLLREHSPIHRVENGDRLPFWAITRHEDIISISRRPELFLNAPRLVMNPTGEGEPGDVVPGTGLPANLRSLLNMDPPDHNSYRSLVNKRFTPRALTAITAQVDNIATSILDDIGPNGGKSDGAELEIDFVERVSARLPIWVIAEMLGVPRSDWQLLFDWTNRVVGSGDPEFQDPDKDATETLKDARASLFEYFSEMTQDRRKNPRDDLVSILTHSTLGGAPLPTLELLSYYFLLVVAGNETTRNATTGGLLALIENPDQLELARNDPSLLKPLVEEVVRWTAPVVHFCRTAAEDVEFRGVKFRKNDTLCLFYPSANRDERVFDEPDRFRVDRRPNRHLSFGIGEHVCLGAHVARLELQVIFKHMLARFESVELAGEVERLRSCIVGGIKHMPIRYRIRPA